MTLRQEPTVALLVAGVMACCVRFAREPGVGPLAIAAILIPLAATAHPAGIVALAPLIAVSPAAIRWARDRPASAVAVFTASGALLLTLAFVGSDVQVRASDARTLREASYTVVDWRDELTRYTYLTDEDPDGVTGYGTPLRRAAAALMLLAALGFIGRARRERRALLDLPALTLVTALLMLVATPSKWPWHFGALIAVVAVAVATETVRVHDDSSRGWRARPFVVIAAVVLAIAWSWSPRGGWNVIDLRTLDWTPAIEAWLPFSKLAIALPLVLLAGGMTVAWRRGRGAPSVPWRVASWSAPMLVVPLVAFTAGVLIVDAVRTESWTTTRANLQALAGERTCGVASELPVLDDNSPQALPIHEAAGRTRTSRWVPRPPVSGLPVFALGPAVEATSSSPWFSVSRGQRPGLFVSGEIATRDRLELEWGEVKDGRIERLRSDDVDISLTSERNATLPWRFVSAGELAVPPTEATLVRLTLFNDERSRSAVAVTAPVIYTNESLEQRLRVPVTVALVQPNVLTFLPCARLPRLADGIVEVPETLVTTKDSFGPVQYFETSPFAGVFDLYDLERLPLADSENPPRTFVVFGVDRRVQGAVLAPPDRTTTIS